MNESRTSRRSGVRAGLLLIAVVLAVGIGSVISGWTLGDLAGWPGVLDIFVLGSGGFVILAIWGYLATSPDGPRAELSRALHRRPRDRH